MECVIIESVENICEKIVKKAIYFELTLDGGYGQIKGFCPFMTTFFLKSLIKRTFLFDCPQLLRFRPYFKKFNKYYFLPCILLDSADNEPYVSPETHG